MIYLLALIPAQEQWEKRAEAIFLVMKNKPMETEGRRMGEIGKGMGKVPSDPFLLFQIPHR